MNAWDADVALTAETVQQLLSAQFADLVVQSVQPLGEGWDNIVYEVNEEYIFRFPRRVVAIECLQTENLVLPQIAHRLPLPIPVPTYIGQPSKHYPRPFAGYRKLSGRPPHVRTVSESERGVSAASFGEFLRTLHAISGAEGRNMGISGDAIGRMYIPKRISQFYRYLSEAKKLGLIENTEQMKQIIADIRPAHKQFMEDICLVHGDLNFRNFLVDDVGKLSGVIDWGDVHIGHPACDLSIVHSYLPAWAHEKFLQAYGKIDELTWQLARFRALYTNLYILVYAHNIHDTMQMAEARYALCSILGNSDEPL